MTNEFQIQQQRTFTTEDVTAVTQLDALCQAADGFDIRIGLDALPHRTGENVQDFLCYQGVQLVGYLNFFSFDDQVAEVTGIVHPEHRRQGVFTQLLAAAEAEMKVRGIHTVALVVHMQSASGQAFAQHIGAKHRNTEYTMQLKGLKPLAHRYEAMRLRVADTDDFEFLVACSSRAFGDPEDWTRSLLQRTNEPNRVTYVAMLDETPIGMIRSFHFGETGVSIHGFAVLPEEQGRGYGRQILSDTVQIELDNGRTDVELDVETDNDNALGLYRSCGFEVESAYGFYTKSI